MQQASQLVKNLERDFLNYLDKKVDVLDITKWLNNKADLDAVNSALLTKVYK
jgi:hypothetical protein